MDGPGCGLHRCCARSSRTDRVSRVSHRIDWIVAAALLCVGAWWGGHAVRAFEATGGAPSFYQSEFAPAVMFACGQGLRNPDATTGAVLAPFLDRRADRVSCADLPRAAGNGALDAFQNTQRYLEMTVGATWKVVGVSWSRLAALNGLLFGLVAALTYGIYRLALGRCLALAGMVPVFLSTPNLDLVPHLRDYAKGPFLLAAIGIMGALVVRRRSARAVVALCALAGAIVGFGLGFRTDLMIAAPPFVLVAAFLVPDAPRRVRAAAVAAFVTSFVLLALPLITQYSRGNNIGPVALLGLTAPFDAALRVQPSIYEYGGQYNDSLAFSIVNSYVVRIEGRHDGVDLATPEQASASMAYLFALARIFPADIVTRVLTACRTTVRYFLDSSLAAPSWLRSPTLRAVYRVRGAVSWRLAPLAVPAIVLATLLVAANSMRAAWLIVVVWLTFAGAAAIQFHERHFFYLQFVPWMVFGFLVQAGVDARDPARRASADWRQAAAFALIVAAACSAAVLATRVYQQRSATALFGRYLAAPRSPVALVARTADGSRVRLTADGWAAALPANAPRVATRFVALQFRDRECGAAVLPVRLRYESTLPELDFSETVSVPLGAPSDPSSMLVFPAFDRPGDSSRFRGLEVSSALAGCVERAFEVHGLDRESVLLTTWFSADWRSRPLYQRMQ